ncbi:hypothetical protein J8273_0133 [Carpediemonas membranifera]|uniref:Uncharacterized protein n=1 Tax=Carpediemonas membranifera TaxID=201153 RepID=A0A8J6AXH8_9EUKA|nr:hypothetical protein J8273_0133 [Carpediemonas membranifera]|eukprot:KAG9394925.1 hypothetical protein J8273_0133 [Carpediemonas membranifera]
MCSQRLKSVLEDVFERETDFGRQYQFKVDTEPSCRVSMTIMNIQEPSDIPEDVADHVIFIDRVQAERTGLANQLSIDRIKQLYDVISRRSGAQHHDVVAAGGRPNIILSVHDFDVIANDSGSRERRQELIEPTSAALHATHAQVTALDPASPTYAHFMSGGSAGSGHDFEFLVLRAHIRRALEAGMRRVSRAPPPLPPPSPQLVVERDAWSSPTGVERAERMLRRMNIDVSPSPEPSLSRSTPTSPLLSPSRDARKSPYPRHKRRSDLGDTHFEIEINLPRNGGQHVQLVHETDNAFDVAEAIRQRYGLTFDHREQVMALVQEGLDRHMARRTGRMRERRRAEFARRADSARPPNLTPPKTARPVLYQVKLTDLGVQKRAEVVRVREGDDVYQLADGIIKRWSLDSDTWRPLILHRFNKARAEYLSRRDAGAHQLV